MRDGYDEPIRVTIGEGKYYYTEHGNKRTATLFANLFMIQNGLGILSIPVEKKLEFYNALTAFYDNDSNISELKRFLRDYCLTGSDTNSSK